MDGLLDVFVIPRTSRLGFWTRLTKLLLHIKPRGEEVIVRRGRRVAVGRSRRRMEEIRVLPGVRNEVAFRLEEGLGIEGAVVDREGRPLRGIRVAFNESKEQAAIALARTAYDTRNFTLLPILADALEEAGCDHPDVLNHCRDPRQVHVRGCWVVDGVLGKE